MKKKYIVKYTGTNDYIFKTLFQNPQILSSYLRLLGIEVSPEEIIYENVEAKEEVKIKAVRFDIRIQSRHMHIDIEGQRQKIRGKDKKGKEVESETYQRHRKIHYLSVLHSKAYEEGEKYFEERQSKVIFFLDYDIEGEDYIRRTKLVNQSTKEVYDEIEIIEIVLKKVKGYATLEERMLGVLSKRDITEYYEEKGIVGGVAKMIYELNAEEHAKNVARYEADMRRMEKDYLEARYYDGYYTGKDEGVLQGRSEGILQGKEEVYLSTVRKLKELGMTNEFISQATGLSEKEIEKLVLKTSVF